MSSSDTVRNTDDPADSHGQHGRTFLNLGRLMVVLGLVNPPLWGALVRGATREVIIACVVFSGLMIVFGAIVTLVGRRRLAGESKDARGQRNGSNDCRQ